MASNTDEAERRVREQRALIQQKLNNLEDRVGEDLTHAQERLKHHMTHAADMLPGGPKIIEQVEAHPAAAMFSGLGIGVAAGMMGGGDSSNSRNGSHRGSNSSGMMGGAATMFGSLTTSLITPLRPYMEDAAKQVIAGFSDRQRSARDSMSSAGGSSSDGYSERRDAREDRAPASGSRSGLAE